MEKKDADYIKYLSEKYGKYCLLENKECPKVSVIVPCYNVEKYIEDCLASLIKQTFNDIEIICVNDGSTDSTPQKLNAFSEIDRRIVVINQENKGLSGARNTGIKNALGEYITFVDSDDWISENYLGKLYDAIVRNNADVSASTIIRWRKNHQKYRVHYTEEKVYEALKDKLEACSIPKCCYVWNKLYKSELVKENLFKEGVFFEDMLWTPNILKNSNKLVTVSDTAYFYRVNQNSIVKKKPSLKKQYDSYKAHKYIIDYFRENNLTLGKKYETITKRINYFLNFPITRVKEYQGYETTLLFNLLPVKKEKSSLYYKFKKNKSLFLLRDLDSHYYINILGLHLSFKHKKIFKNQKVSNFGITDKKRNPQLIVSLASYPARINTVYKTIETLLNQTVKQDRLILWLANEQFPNKEADLPENLLKLREFGFEIGWCEDLKSYKKLVPALRKFPNDIIVTADDDLYYQEDWLESLYNAYLKDPKNIYTRRACRVTKEGNIFKIAPHYSNTHYEPDYSNQLMGGAGTIYPPNSLHEDVLNTDLIKTLVPTYDDIYFWAMAVLAGTKIGLIKNKDLSIYNVEGTQDDALCKINGQSDRMNDKEAFNRIFEKYPEIIRRIDA